MDKSHAGNLPAEALAKAGRFSAQQAGLILLYLGLGAASALLWARINTYQPLVPGQPPRLYSWHDEMMSGNAAAPNQYRILTPWLAEAIRPLIPNQDLMGAYFLIRALATWLALLLLDRYMRTWFSTSAAAGGALLLAAVIPFTYYRVVQESDPINLAVVVGAFLAISRERDLWLFPLMLVGTLNRETTAMIPMVYFLGRWRSQPAAAVLTRTGLLAACWAAVYGGLVLHYGHKGYYTEVFMLPANLSSWLPSTFALLVFGVLWLLPFLALKKQPPVLLRRTIWLLLPFVALQYLVGVVQEVRLFLPLAPIVIPLSWWVLFPDAIRSPGPADRARGRAVGRGLRSPPPRPKA